MEAVVGLVSAVCILKLSPSTFRYVLTVKTKWALPNVNSYVNIELYKYGTSSS